MANPGSSKTNSSNYEAIIPHQPEGLLTLVLALPVPILVRSIVILGDLLVLGITWNKSMDVFRTSRRIRNFRPKISILLIRDGTLYFVAIAMLNLVALLLVTSSLFLEEHGGTGFIFVVDAGTSVLVSRFILNLRGIANDVQDGDTTLDHSMTSSIAFATHSFLGNFAAPLRTGFTEESDSRGIYQRAKEPFMEIMVGLGPDHDRPKTNTTTPRICPCMS
ncbi:hypothetical protein BXZ70DRAFT_511400 [Cristinia sonorae]|uniref:Uncharacterized protein n=1 Tax=Cristinia sonorae TaxID=1940300 RepID=A0A8K0UWG6_9AGAR|nr:hypothetical protein BXZ70DRAFT_511400 [Cristinia sonorae]